MLIQCGWCDKNMGEKEPLENKSITHGICDKCFKKYFGDKDDKVSTP